jgi:hypothetical protein
MTKADTKLLTEARASISRLNATLNQGQNRFGSYGDNVRASIKRWEQTIARLTNEKAQ